MSTYRPRATAGESVAFAQDVKVKYTANQECADECRTLILQLCESVLNVHDLMTAWVSPVYSSHEIKANEQSKYKEKTTLRRPTVSPPEYCRRNRKR